jgi:hypothetical protein
MMQSSSRVANSRTLHGVTRSIWAGYWRAWRQPTHQAGVIAQTSFDPSAQMIADSMVGISCHLSGHQVVAARTHCQAVLSQSQTLRYDIAGRLGYDLRIRTLMALTHTLWLLGYSNQGVSVAAQTLEEAERLGHPVSLAFAHIYVATILVRVVHLKEATRVIEGLLAHSERLGLDTYYAVGIGL